GIRSLHGSGVQTCALPIFYPEAGQNRLADQLKIVARLISGGLKTKIYVVNINGFDTHANQVESGDTSSGEHAQLLSDLSEAILRSEERRVGKGEKWVA